MIMYCIKCGEHVDDNAIDHESFFHGVIYYNKDDYPIETRYEEYYGRYRFYPKTENQHIVEYMWMFAPGHWSQLPFNWIAA